ncbi:MFS transporter [Solirubrobacter sp. CPCC 204708]|uniref:MFS transporter n=1 Tax=Solirubrobacter deserti TaxID=2282478 RepID=A0ABT4RGG3_9ACTN|nr:MFS transporter [Solirubrobacter deserti]MBE2318185.1 MFS transporter [Solirubrobacter deserti]MDA0137466.1 MFS transporter [Solirubrobacter deserti]
MTRRRLLAALAAAGAGYALMQSFLAPALPDLQRAFAITPATASWVMTGYLLSASVLTPVIGRLGDLYGKHRVLLAVLLVLCAGTLLGALASSIEVLVAARLVQGAGGGVFPLAFAIVRDELEPRAVPGALGFLSGILSAGAGAGIVLAGPVVEHLSYHWLFWLPLAGIALATVAVWRTVPASPVRASGGRIHWTGMALMAAGLSAALLALTWGDAVLGAAGLALLPAWVWAERRAPVPLVDMRVLARRTVWTTNLTTLLLGAGLFAFGLLIPQLAPLLGTDVTGAGLLLLPSTVTLLAFSSAAGRLEARFGSRACLTAGALCSCLSFVLCAVAYRSVAGVAVASAVMGAGIGLSYAAMVNLVMGAVDLTQSGVATGVNQIMRTIGGSVGATLSATIVVAHGFAPAFWVIAGLLAAAVAASALVPRYAAAATAGCSGVQPVPSIRSMP